MRRVLFFLALAGCSSGGGGGGESPKAGTETKIGTPRPGFIGELPKGAMVVSDGEIGRYGGQLVLAQPGDPKTLNPIIANDVATNDILHGPVFESCLGFHNGKQVEKAGLCEKWEKSEDGMTYTFTLREGLTWSDGQPITSDDFAFSYAVTIDPAVQTAAADLFRQGVDEAGKARFPTFEVVDARTFRFKLAQRDVLFHYAVGSIYAVPKAKWEAAYKAGDFGQAMRINTPPGDIPTSGPFVIKEVRSDERVVLERNPRFWKVDRDGNRLPYLDRVIVLVVPDFNASFLKFREGETDVLEVRPEHYDPLRRKESAGDYLLSDLGPSFNTNWIIFNQDRRLSSEGKPYVDPMKQKWFQNKQFRKAISHAIDREGIVRTVMAGRGQPLWAFSSPANKTWWTEDVVKYPYDLEKARALLTEAGFTTKDGKLFDAEGNHIEFSMTTNAENSTRIGMLNVIKDDLAKLGVTAHIRPVPFNDLLTSLRSTRDFDALLLGWGAAVPPDPTQSKNVLLSSGASHAWAPLQEAPATEWEKRMDELVYENAGTDDMAARLKTWHELEKIFSDEQPQIQLVVQNFFVAGRKDIGNFSPALLRPTTHWNIEQLFKKDAKAP
ncbi:MAG: ABC transporter substrate-binding protein [bacterium]